MEQAVIVHLRLSDGAFGSCEERRALFDLEEQLESAIAAAGVGEFDGDEFGEGECVLYMYGPQADQLWAVVEPVLGACPCASSGYAIKRYGEATDVSAQVIPVAW